MPRLKFDKLNKDDKAGVEIGMAVGTVLITISTVLTAFKITTNWDPSWIWILLPTWIPLAGVFSFKIVQMITRYFIDFSEEET